MRRARRRSLLGVLVLVGGGGLGALPAARAEAVEDAVVLWQHDRLHEALVELDAVLAGEPDRADARGYRALTLFDLGRFEAAIADAERAAAGDPGEWAALPWRLQARRAFFYGDDAAVRRHLARFRPEGDDDEDHRELPYLIEPAGLGEHSEPGGRYRVYADEALQETGGQEFTARVMELVFKAYSKVFPFDQDEALVHRVYVFGETQAYLAFGRRALGEDGEGAAGYFVPRTRILVIDADPEGGPTNKQGLTASAIDTMFHEGFHQFAHVFVPQGVPSWFGEGFAEYFGPSTLRGRGRLNVGVVNKESVDETETRYATLMQALARDDPTRPLSLRAYMTQSEEAFAASDARTSVNYAQGWSVIHFLLHGQGQAGRRACKAYFHALREGQTPARAFERAFGGFDLDALDRAWQAYVRRL